MHHAAFRLRSFSFAARLGLTAMLAVFAIGLWASAEYIRIKHENKDERPGVSMLDLVGTYHGVSVPSPLRESLESGHPEELAPKTRAALIAWLSKDTNAISRDYDNLDLGDTAPSEVIAVDCLACHSRAEAPTLGADVVLDNWEAVSKIAFPININPMPYGILIASTHAHALTLAAIGALLALMLAFTRWRRGLVGVLVFALGVGLFLDVGSWWAARWDARFVYTIVAGGALFNFGAVLALLLIFGELWLPRPRGERCDDSRVDGTKGRTT